MLLVAQDPKEDREENKEGNDEVHRKVMFCGGRSGWTRTIDHRGISSAL